MASRFTQYGGAAGADAALQQMVAERIAAQMEAQKRAVEAYKIQQDDRRITQGDRRIDLDQEQFGQTMGLNRDKFGQDKAEFEAGAPQREAQTGYLRTQTRDLEQKPLYAEQARQAQEARDKTQHGYRLGEIGAQGRETRAGRTTEITVQENGQWVTKRVPEAETVGKSYPVAPSAAERMDARKFSKARPVMRGIGELSQRINTQQGVIATISGTAERAKAQANLNDDVAEYESLVSGFTPLVARSLGHTGVLTQQDVDSVRQIFPQPKDSKTLRDRKIQRLEGIFSELEGNEAPQSGGGVEYDFVDGQLVPRPR